MRSGGSSALQQTLTAEAASVLKHSLMLARRRNHPQVTPLHVAITLLTLRLSSFKRACLKSHQPHQQTSHSHSHHHNHPLQSRALELCFNVALNRLPTTPSPLIHSQVQPSLSNALIAALKRAQAHQRRGSIEQQQQNVVTVRVELEQLIISILDDPSVSRVMREAGYSSTLVKNNLEDSCSPSNSVFKCYNSSGGGVFSSPCSPSTSENHRENINLGSFRQNHFMPAKFNSSEFNSVIFSPPKRPELMSISTGLGLTLQSSSVLDSMISTSQNTSHIMETKPFSSNKEHEDKLNCCEECASNYEKEALFLRPEQKKTLPFWLQSHDSTEEQNKDGLNELKRKWNRLCQCLHQNKQHQNNWNWSNNNHSSNTNISSSSISYSPNLTPRFRRQQSCTIEFNFNDNKRQATEPVFDSLLSMEDKEVNISLALGNGESNQKVENITDTKLQQDHVLKILQENVPWQNETIPSIVKALIDTKSTKQSEIRFTWLFLQGNDFIGKRRLSLAIAESVFGSADLVLQLNMLKKETSITPFSEMLLGALRKNPKLVVLIENVDFADIHFMKYLSDAYEKGKFENLSTKEGNSGQVIFILTNGESTCIEENNKTPVFNLLWQISETNPNFLGSKRKAELGFFPKIKNPRVEENQKGLLISEQGSKKEEFLTHSSINSNTLDLNMKADEEKEEKNSEEKTRESTSISNGFLDNPLNSNGFLDSIKNRFEFNTNSAKESEKTESFLSKIKGSFEEVYGKKNVVNFSVDEKVIENMIIGCCFFTNKMFEKWLKDIFQRSLETVNFGGKEGILFRLCLGDNRNWDNGFMGSSLPKSIEVNYFVE